MGGIRRGHGVIGVEGLTYGLNPGGGVLEEEPADLSDVLGTEGGDELSEDGFVDGRTAHLRCGR